MKELKHPLPPGRTLEQLWNHYQVEAALANRLKAANRAGRRPIFETMYAELFAAVPDHPRLTVRADPQLTEVANRAKMNVLRPWIDSESVVVEFASGDCEFTAALAPHVKRAIGVDISDQRAQGRAWPANFELIVYDGDSLPQVAPGTIDVIVSFQFLEHLHPDDAMSHLELAYSLLKPGGCYVIETPHAATGPWDVSRYFSDEPEGFHLKEWTFGELRTCLRRIGYSKVRAACAKRGLNLPVPYAYFTGVEFILRRIKRSVAQKIGRPLVPMVLCAAYK
jgi:SAM-dependent methyltransferase